MCAWPPGGMIGPSLCSLWTRVSVLLCAYLTDDGRADPGLACNHLGDAFFIFPRVTQKPPLSPDMDPREVSSHDLGESYAAAVQGPSIVNRSATGLEMGSAMQVSYAAAV